MGTTDALETIILICFMMVLLDSLFQTGDTALTFACFRGYLAFVKIIVENIPAEHQKKLINHQRNVIL